MFDFHIHVNCSGGRDGLLPAINGRQHFLTLSTTLRNLGHDLFDEFGQRSARKPQRFLGALFNRAIYANIHLRHAANSTHVDPLPSIASPASTTI